MHKLSGRGEMSENNAFNKLIIVSHSLFDGCFPPLQILWIIPQKVVRWVLVMFSLCLSGSVLVMTFWPAVRDDNRRIALATVGAIILLHALLSVGCLV